MKAETSCRITTRGGSHVDVVDINDRNHSKPIYAEE